MVEVNFCWSVCVIVIDIIVREFVKILQKTFWFSFIEFTGGYLNGYERFFNFKQTWWDYKTFISTFFTTLKLINLTETQWVISLHKLFFHQRDFFIKIWWNSSWTIKIVIDYTLLIAVTMTFLYIPLWKPANEQEDLQRPDLFNDIIQTL